MIQEGRVMEQLMSGITTTCSSIGCSVVGHILQYRSTDISFSFSCEKWRKPLVIVEKLKKSI